MRICGYALQHISIGTISRMTFLYHQPYRHWLIWKAVINSIGTCIINTLSSVTVDGGMSWRHVYLKQNKCHTILWRLLHLYQQCLCLRHILTFKKLAMFLRIDDVAVSVRILFPGSAVKPQSHLCDLWLRTDTNWYSWHIAYHRIIFALILIYSY